MAREYRNSLSNTATKSKNKNDSVYVINKDDILLMFNKKELDKKSKKIFGILK